MAREAFEWRGEAGTERVPEILRVVREESLVDESGAEGRGGLRKELAAHLYKNIADTYVLRLKTAKYFWNARGPWSYSLRKLLEPQYKEQSSALKHLALRIRALAFEVPGSLIEFLELSEIRERKGTLDTSAMASDLIAGHEILVRNLRSSLEAFERAGDAASVTAIGRQLASHEKSVWMLSGYGNDLQGDTWRSQFSI